MLKIALIGNPNTGKTSLFNNLTGTYQYVGNWSGVTVEKKVGTFKNKRGNLIDLPGIHSLNPLSKDEAVVSHFFMTEPFDGLINVVDASQIERNLLLTIQLLEFRKATIIGLNMTDVAKRRGISINESILSELLQVPVVPVVARSGKGTDTINDLLTNIHQSESEFMIHYGEIVEDSIDSISRLLPATLTIPNRWTAIQLLEGNAKVREFISFENAVRIDKIIDETSNKLNSKYGVPNLSKCIYTVRKEFIKQLIEKAVVQENANNRTLTGKIDNIVMHPFFGIPIFLLTMFLMFKLTFDWLGLPLSDLLDMFLSGPLMIWLTSALTAINASSFIQAVVWLG